MDHFTQEEIDAIMKQYQDLDLSWYQSTRGPEISATLIGFSGIIVTMVKVMFNITIGTDLLNLFITAAMVITFGVYTLWGYYKSRKYLLGKIAEERLVSKILSSDLTMRGISPDQTIKQYRSMRRKM